jgi:hypothetical protein
MSAVLVLLAATVGGTLATYFVDDRSRVYYRLAAGACIGNTVLGLLGYILAAWFGMGVTSVVTAALVVMMTPALVNWRLAPRLARDVAGACWRGVGDVWAGRPGLRLRVALFLAALVLLWPLFGRAMYEKPEGIYTGYVDNFADLTLHLGIITGFSDGQNFPPEHPEFAGTRLAYPFLVDFVAAMLVSVGASPRWAMFAQSYLLTVALILIFYVWARRLTGSRRAALLVPFLVLLNGGLGFTMLFGEMAHAADGAWNLLTHLSHDYSAFDDMYRWDNSFVNWFVPMRSMLLGVPLFLIVTGLWWRALGHEPPEIDPAAPPPPVETASASVSVGRKRRRKSAAPLPVSPLSSMTPSAPVALFSPLRTMIGAGVIAGLLPLAHAHTFMTLMLMGGCLTLITREWRLFFFFALAASVLALPQGLWAISGTAAKAETFFAWNFGWTGHERMDKWIASWQQWKPIASLSASAGTGFLVPNVLRTIAIAWYWFINTGVFIPLLVVALRWKRGGRVVRKSLRVAYLPFVLCFLIPNVIKLAPWDWDNIKVLIYWFIPSVPLVALLLVRLTRWRRYGRPLAACLFVLMCLSGALDIWRVLTGALEWQDFDADEIAAAEMIKQTVPPRARLLTAAVHNHPFLLAGRRSFMGYPGTLWTHGIDYAAREAVVNRIYGGDPETPALLKENKIDYIVVGPLERIAVKQLSEPYFAQHFAKAAEGHGTILYKVE